MPELDLEAIEARANAATEGPWHGEHDEFGCVQQGNYGWVAPGAGPEYDVDSDRGHADAEFIAHARTDVPDLLAELKRLRPVVEAALAVVEQMRPIGVPLSLRMRHLHQVVAHFERGPQEHPERSCNRCGGCNVAWSAPSPLWNQVMRGGDINAGYEDFAGIVCPTCFAVLAQEAGVAELWRFYAERVHVELATVTPSGRVWNERTWLWEERDGSAPIESAPAGHVAECEGGHGDEIACWEMAFLCQQRRDAPAEDAPA